VGDEAVPREEKMTMTPTSKTKIVGGLVLPATDPGAWLVRDGMVNGYPAYQYDRLQAAVGYCKRKRTCIDGGAHIGSWSVHLASLFKKVLAFEPVPDNADCFAINLATQKNTTLYRAALSDRTGTMHLSNKGGKSVSWAQTADPEALTIPCVPLDALLLTDVDLIKLDVEGCEHEALVGATKTITRCKPVIVIEEKHDLEFKASELLLSLGMTLVTQMKHDRIFTWEST
jgi:FkbM family methyltransferase